MPIELNLLTADGGDLVLPSAQSLPCSNCEFGAFFPRPEMRLRQALLGLYLDSALGKESVGCSISLHSTFLRKPAYPGFVRAARETLREALMLASSL